MKDVEFNERGYWEYQCFQVFLLKYNNEYYVLSQPFLMRQKENVLMLQWCADISEAKFKFNEMIDYNKNIMYPY